MTCQCQEQPRRRLAGCLPAPGRLFWSLVMIIAAARACEGTEAAEAALTSLG